MMISAVTSVRQKKSLNEYNDFFYLTDVNDDDNNVAKNIIPETKIISTQEPKIKQD